MTDIDTGFSEHLICDQCGASARVRMVLHRTGEMSGGDHIVEFRQPPCTRCGSKELHWEIEDCPQCHARTKNITLPGCRTARECQRCRTSIVSPDEPAEPTVSFLHPTRSDAWCSRCGERLSRSWLERSGRTWCRRFDCSVCGAIRHPLSRINYVEGIRLDDLAKKLVAAEIARHVNGISFEELLSVLSRDYVESSLRPKYIRAYIEDCIKEGSVVAWVGDDGAVWYRAASRRGSHDSDE